MKRIDILRTSAMTDGCLLHGSPKRLEEIHPHLTDGEVAICATIYPEIAIFMAVARGCKGQCAYRVEVNSKRWQAIFTICPKVVHALLKENPRGYVYSLDSQGFEKRNYVEYRVMESRYSIGSLTVTKEDLPFIPIEGETTYVVPLNPAYASLWNQL